ncbi:MAG: tetratricopeptide repeat protein [Desulfovibrio sp.]|jgi:lipopolysaccharide biosynthesis regulator YciM|nr:tetratricopeptide repeat protein [Desulfovibrio sp.]
MSFFRWLAGFFASGEPEAPPRHYARFQEEGRESLAAVNELSRLFTDNGAPTQAFVGHDAAEIPLALGNLYRAQGDIDRAVALREAVLSRQNDNQGQNDGVSARTYFELGRDYRTAGFLDRAVDAFREARKLGFSEQAIRLELARLYADSGEFSAAASEYTKIDMPYAAAHFLVRQAEEIGAEGKDEAALRLLRQAINVYPGSPEVRRSLACMSLMAGSASESIVHLRAGLAKGDDSARLILLEGLYAFIRGGAAPDIDMEALDAVAASLGEIIGELGQSLTLCYYAGLFLHRVGRKDEAEQWFTKCLILDPDFWAARLALLALCAEREPLPPLLAQQIAFFTEQGLKAKRFLCPPCGLRRDTIFSRCPRCQDWHSVTFRPRLT